MVVVESWVLVEYLVLVVVRVVTVVAVVVPLSDGAAAEAEAGGAAGRLVAADLEEEDAPMGRADVDATTVLWSALARLRILAGSRALGAACPTEARAKAVARTAA